MNAENLCNASLKHNKTRLTDFRVMFVVSWFGLSAEFNAFCEQNAYGFFLLSDGSNRRLLQYRYLLIRLLGITLKAPKER
jgi:hypothetical protein